MACQYLALIMLGSDNALIGRFRLFFFSRYEPRGSESGRFLVEFVQKVALPGMLIITHFVRRFPGIAQTVLISA